jgi:hypothetical protein
MPLSIAHCPLSISCLHTVEKLCVRVLLAPQVLYALTVTLPVPFPQVTSMLVEFCPAVMVPFGAVQIYCGIGDTVATLKFTNPPSHHPDGFAVMDAGVDGAPLMVIAFEGLVAGAQAEEFATTETNPEVKLEGTLNWMVWLPWPMIFTAPAGSVQV